MVGNAQQPAGDDGGYFGIKKTLTNLFSSSKWTEEQSASSSTQAAPVVAQQPGSPLIAAVRNFLNKTSGSGSTTGETASAGSASGSFTGYGPPPVVPGRKSTLLAVCPQLPPSMQRPEWRLDDYVISDKLYAGYASVVFKAMCKRSREVVVLKCYSMPNTCELYQHQIYREVRLHSSLQHENIVKLFAAFQEGSYVVMVQEYADGGDLFALLQKYGGRLSERIAVQMILDPFIRVLQYMHTRGIIHRDIKPENILFTKGNMCLKLADFGLAIDLRKERAVTRAGTLDYMAPEVLKCPYKSKPEENKEKVDLQYDNTVDSWAVGVLTYELLVGCPPFYSKRKSNTEIRIKSSRPTFPAIMTEAARDFVMNALRKNPAERPSITEMVHHPWIELYRARRSMRQLNISTAASSTTAGDLAAPDTSVAKRAMLKHSATSKALGAGSGLAVETSGLQRILSSIRDEDEHIVTPSANSVPTLVTHLSGVSLKTHQDIISQLTAANEALKHSPVLNGGLGERAAKVQFAAAPQ